MANPEIAVDVVLVVVWEYAATESLERGVGVSILDGGVRKVWRKRCKPG
jgi:hypothetical protein